MGDISKRLSRHEFACKCGCGFQTADFKLISILELLADHFESLNPVAVRVAVHINSGDRCAVYDEQLKRKIAADKGVPYTPGEKPSEHLFGWAADFWMEYVYDNGDRVKIDDDLIADELEDRFPAAYGIGRYAGRTHFDTRTNGPARWDRR